MFDHYDGLAFQTEFFDDGDNAGNFRQAQARKKLIKNDKVGLQRNGFGQFQSFEIALGQHAGIFISHK